MLRSRSLLRTSIQLVLGATLAAGPCLAGEMCAAPGHPGPPAATAAPAALTTGDCSAWTHTLYFTDATHTTSTGSCSITCRQYDLGSANPTFEEGGTCSGTESAYPVDLFSACPCPF